jgi:L-ascorbate metabolism protein UlaG (beta-lactamase superfamily)
VLMIVLSHLHEDHFDKLVAEKLNRSIPIISTSHATEKLKEDGHLELYPLETWEKLDITKGGNKNITITSMPGKHTLGIFDKANELLHAIPPVMGSMITFDKFTMYISGDTLYYDELKVLFLFSAITLPHRISCCCKIQSLTVGNSSTISGD